MKKTLAGTAIAAAIMGATAITGMTAPAHANIECGNVVFPDGLSEDIWVFNSSVSCEEAMSVAHTYVEKQKAQNSRFYTFDGWSCQGTTAGEVDQGDYWDIECENISRRVSVLFIDPDFPGAE